MNILLLSPNDWGSANYVMCQGFNAYTEHSARSITEMRHPFGYDTDIVIQDLKTKEELEEVDDLIESADFFLAAQGVPHSIATKVLNRKTYNNLLMRYSGSDVRNRADLLFKQQLNNRYHFSATAYDFSMTRCLIQSIHHNTHIIDTDKWAPLENKKFRPGAGHDSPISIYHSPTNNEIKGTEYIIKAIDNLSKKYNIKWVHTGCESDGRNGEQWSEVMKQKRNADIFIDSVDFYDHGQNTVEAMCFGIPVLTRLCDYYMSIYPDTPIVNVNKENIEKKIKWLILKPEIRQNVGDLTREYCEETFNIKHRIAMWANIVEFILHPTADPIYEIPKYWKRQLAIYYNEQVSAHRQYLQGEK
jgi:glycosyltransferase involved in cell wall biosynthesis